MQCGESTESGFSTCSADCNLAYRAGESKPGTDPNEPVEYDKPPEGVELFTAEQLSEKIPAPIGSIYVWKAKGKIPSYQIGPRKVRFDLAAVLKALGREASASPIESVKAEPKVDEIAAMLVKASSNGPWLDRALKAAKQAFREVMLEQADDAKVRGDHKERAEALEAFVFFEDGLQLVYTGRNDFEMPIKSR